MEQSAPKGATRTPDHKNLKVPEAAPKPPPAKLPKETGGPKGLEPTRYGDWESKGRCIDF